VVITTSYITVSLSVVVLSTLGNDIIQTEKDEMNGCVCSSFVIVFRVYSGCPRAIVFLALLMNDFWSLLFVFRWKALVEEQHDSSQTTCITDGNESLFLIFPMKVQRCCCSILNRSILGYSGFLSSVLKSLLYNW